MHALTRLFGAPTLVLALLAGSALSHVATAQDAVADQSGPDVRAAVESAKARVFPSVVNITVRTVTYWGGKENKGGSIGSGTIISPDGLVLTNHHVVEDGRTYRVTLADKREADATLVGKDPLTDLALLRIDRASLKDDAPLPYATFGDSDSVKVGEYVMAMGAPFGLSRTVTLGIVSNTERVFTSSTGDDLADQEFDAETSSDIFTRWLQHDALINPGNSGGPLVNLRGEIVGVNTRGGTGMGFAVPANLARAVAGQLAEKGEVVRSTIGVALKSVKRSGHADGVLVNSVQAEGPAGKAGIKPGDVLIEMDGAPLSARFPEDIPLIARTIADRPVGSQVQFKVVRAGETLPLTLTTEKLLREKGDEAAFRTWGFSAREITERLARNRKLDDRKGAIIFGVRAGGPAAIAEPSLQAGDVIRAVDGKPVADLSELVARYAEISSGTKLPEFVLVEFDSGGKSQVTLIKPRPDQQEDPPREVPKAWIGIATQPILKELAQKLGLGDSTGFRITRIYPGTLAAKADLKVGDVVVALNGDRLAPRGMQDAGMFQRLVRRLPSTGDATLRVIRAGETVEVSLPIERTRLAPEEATRDTNNDFEITVRELTFFDRDDNRWDDSIQGVMVVSTVDGGWAAAAGIYTGDVIQRIDDAAVTDISTYRAAMKRIKDTQPARVTFVVLRGQRTQFKFAEPDWKPIVAHDHAGE